MANISIGRARGSVLVTFAASAGLALASFSAMPSRPALAGTTSPYSIIESPAHGTCIATECTNEGEVCGAYQDGNNLTQPFRWDLSNGFEPLDRPNGSPSAQANGLNESGVVVGSSFISNRNHPTIWVPEMEPITIQLPKGYLSGILSRVNEAGNACGTIFDNNFGNHPCLAKVGSPAFDLGLRPEWKSAQSVAINDQGQVLVVGLNQQNVSSTAIWTPNSPNGTAGSFSNLIPGLSAGKDVIGSAMNNDSVVVGMAAGADSKLHAIRFDGKQTTDIGPTNGDTSRANAINEDGNTVGTTFDGSLFKAVKFIPLVNLNTLDPDGPVNMKFAVGINDGGAMLVNGTLRNSAPGGTPQGTDVPIFITPRAEFSITKTVDSPTVMRTNESIFTITIRNNSTTSRSIRVHDSLPTYDEEGKPQPAFEVTDILPGGLRVTDDELQDVELDGAIGAGETVTVTIKAKALAHGDYVNKALVADTLDPSTKQEASVAISVVPFRPTDVTQRTTIKRGALRNGAQTVTVKLNPQRGTQAVEKIPGPLYLVLDELKNAALANQTGVTEGPPAGTPYIRASKKKKISTKEKIKVKLKFTPAKGGGEITYSLRVLAGPGTP